MKKVSPGWHFKEVLEQNRKVQTEYNKNIVTVYKLAWYGEEWLAFAGK